MSNSHLMPQDPNGLLENKTYPFSGKIQVGDWVRGQLVHKFITDYVEHTGIVSYMPSDDILHVTDPVYGDTKVIGIKYVLDHQSKKGR